MIFGHYIRQIRLEKGLSGRGLAKLVDKSASYIGQVETGKVIKPSLSVARKILAALEVKNEEEILLRFGILKDKSERMYLIFDIEDEEKEEHLKNEILIEVDRMGAPQLAALSMLLKKHRDLMMNTYKLEQFSEHTNKNNPVHSIKDYANFLLSIYGKDEKNV